MEAILVNSEQAMKLLGVSASTLYRLRKKGAIKARPLNPNAKCPTWLYSVESIKKFAEGE